MMTRISTARRACLTTIGVGAVLAMPAMSALAGLPEVLDHVPSDATAVVVVDNLNTLDQHVSQFIGAIEMPAMTTPKQAFDQMGIGQNLNMDGSAALVVLSFDPEAEEPEFVLLAPTNNYNALIGGFEKAEGGGGGVDAITIEGTTVFSKKVGAWAVMGAEHDVVANFTGKAGNLGAFAKNLGISGNEMAGKCDLFVTINPAKMGPMIEQMQDGIQENAGNFGGQDLDQQMEMMQRMMESFVRDGSHAGFGLSFGAMGATASGSIAFKPGTEGAKLFTKGGDSASLMGKLPNSPFLIAFAMDHSAPIAKATMEWFEHAGMADMNPMLGAFDMQELHKDMTGASGAVYPNPNGPMAGFFANMITFAGAKNPGKLREAIQQKLSGKQERNEQLGMSISSSFTANASKVAGKNADSYSISMNFGGANAMGGMNPMAIVFGSPNGIEGSMVEANGGIYASFSRMSTMLAPAVEGRSSLFDDKALAQVAKNLPEGRYAEFYIGVSPILQQVVPMLTMFGMPPIDMPDRMPPVGMGVASRDGGAICGVFVPAQTIKSGIQIAESMGGMMGGNHGDWEEDDDPGF